MTDPERASSQVQLETPVEFSGKRSISPTSFIMNVARSNYIKQWPLEICCACKAPSNYVALEKCYFKKISDLKSENGNFEQRLLKVEKDLVKAMDVISQQFMLNEAYRQQLETADMFLEELLAALTNEGRMTFWAHGQEFNVVREFSSCGDANTNYDNYSLVRPQTPSKESYYKATLKQQDRTIRHLVNTVKDTVDLFLQFSVSPVDLKSGTNSSTVNYVDESATTYSHSSVRPSDYNDFDKNRYDQSMESLTDPIKSNFKQENGKSLKFAENDNVPSSHDPVDTGNNKKENAKELCVDVFQEHTAQRSTIANQTTDPAKVCNAENEDDTEFSDWELADFPSSDECSF
ncbi:uncharacterized protein LOC126900043 isoform X4 [Daktulosphaira vitifoliae]|uniref:uncharacterized protein LOC126900043 isoform X4 n=1 Tax=Daktulosphaira vitifoliae TaxID=58002 RepID=UPI0021AAF185|nr:uncharacterized protein LOC126900043 isoform X4 [Daktulosphaira vitifoliae]